MKRLIVLSILFLVSSPNADADIKPETRERIEELVVEPLQSRVVLSPASRFSRALVARQAPKLRLWTSRAATDGEGRTFVPFRLRELVGGESTLPATFTGCYYPDVDAAYLRLGDGDGHVAVDEHPLLTLEMPQALANVSRCRATD